MGRYCCVIVCMKKKLMYSVVLGFLLRKYFLILQKWFVAFTRRNRNNKWIVIYNLLIIWKIILCFCVMNKNEISFSFIWWYLILMLGWPHFYICMKHNLFLCVIHMISYAVCIIIFNVGCKKSCLVLIYILNWTESTWSVCV